MSDWLDPNNGVVAEYEPTVNMTIGYVMDRGRWLDVCDLVGINEWAVSEGQVGRDHEIRVPIAEASRLGLISR